MKMDSHSRLAYLLSRHRDQTLTQDEEQELYALLEETSDDDISDVLEKDWQKSEEHQPFFAADASERMFSRVMRTAAETEKARRRAGRQIFLQRLAAAAAVLVFIASGIFLVVRPESADIKTPDVAALQQKPDAPPAGNKATLTLSSGQTIVLDSAQNGLLATLGGVRVKKTQDGQVLYDATADVQAEAVVYNTLATPRGGQYQVVLPDGSHVWLNAASSLRYPSAFNGATRVIELTGEAYFEVASNPDMPFIVRSGDAEVEVLGTHFNIMAYSDEREMKTTLLEGSVKITGGSETEVLTPGQQAVLRQDGDLTVAYKADAASAIAWKNGLFHFNDTDLRSIMREAARWYDLDISYEGDVPERRFTGSISRNVKASELLSILKYTGVNFEIAENKIIVRP